MGNDKLITILIHAAILVVVLIVSSLFLKKRAKEANQLHKRYLVQLIRLVIILACLVNVWGIFDPKSDLKSLFIKGSALVVAIVGFAAQPAISDLICGLLISINKPFEIGDRIVIEGEQAGIVEDITLRHTVLRTYDDIKIIVPNSQLNNKTVINTSYRMEDRLGIHLRFSVSYDTDVSRAMEVIRDCVAESPYTLHVNANGVRQDSGPVYFLEFAESALMLDTTIWVDRNTSTFAATTDINLRVNEAFKENGIEIPYNYMNVVTFEGEKKQKAEVTQTKKSSPSKRYFRTNNAKVEPGTVKIEHVMQEAKRYASKQRLSPRDQGRLELLAEESVSIIRDIVKEARLNFWVEGSGNMYKIHVTFKPQLGTDEYKRLINLSTSGRNEAVNSLGSRIQEIMVMGLNMTWDQDKDKDKAYKWSLSQDKIDVSQIGQSILVAEADDVKVSVTRDKVEMIVIKNISAEA